MPTNHCARPAREFIRGSFSLTVAAFAAALIRTVAVRHCLCNPAMLLFSGCSSPLARIVLLLFQGSSSQQLSMFSLALVDCTQVDTVWLQFGTDTTKLVVALEWLTQSLGSLRPKRVVGSVFLPTRQLIAQQKFRCALRRDRHTGTFWGESRISSSPIECCHS